ncbi:MAG: hypothetical protein JRJ46_09985 [Deltaproteobacteria bacterium]|nr:hypothetical protein [Deltaproteobacteria bacterium]
MSDFLEIEKARARILGFLALIDDIPGETKEALQRDQRDRAKLLSELGQLQPGLNALAGLSRVGNQLRELRKCL